MRDLEMIPLKSVRPSAIKWGLRHVAVSVGVVLFSRLLVIFLNKVSLGIGSAAYIMINLFGFAIYFLSIGISFYMIYTGMKDYKAHSGSPFFPFTLSLKWSAIFVVLYLVVYGALSLVLTVITNFQFYSSKVDAITALPLMWLAPLLLYVIILAAIALTSGLILKTD